MNQHLCSPNKYLERKNKTKGIRHHNKNINKNIFKLIRCQINNSYKLNLKHKSKTVILVIRRVCVRGELALILLTQILSLLKESNIEKKNTRVQPEVHINTLPSKLFLGQSGC